MVLITGIGVRKEQFMSAKIYYENDIDTTVLDGKKIAMIGYGSQGRAHALNLRDSGLDVRVGVRRGKSWNAAEEDGMRVQGVAEAVQKADITMLAVNDEAQAPLYAEQIQPHLQPGSALAFAHGFNIHYGQIVPSDEIDVLLCAPKGVGPHVRRLYTRGSGIPCLIAVHLDRTGRAKEIALAYAKGLGSARVGVLETTFREETEADLFSEQAVLCGGVTALVKAGFETLVQAGYAPEIAYFECLHELKLIVDLMHEEGIAGMRRRISDTAQYGDMTRGPRIIDEAVRERMRALLLEIQSGEFAREWILENQANRPVFRALAAQDEEHPIEQVGQRLRSLMGLGRPQMSTLPEEVDSQSVHHRIQNLEY